MITSSYSPSREDVNLSSLVSKVEREKTVEFGQHVLFVHLKSNRLLCVQKDDDDAEHYDLTLSWRVSQECIFKIIPCYKS